MRRSTSRQGNHQVAPTNKLSYGNSHHHHQQQGLTSTIQSMIQSPGSELKIQSRRLSRNSFNDRKTIEIVTCDCSISTLGADEFSHDGGLLVLLPESPLTVPSQHRWKQISGSDMEDVDIPPIGPRRSTYIDDSVSIQDGGNDATTSGRQRSILSSPSSASELEASEATDINNEDLSNHHNPAITTAAEELIRDLRMEHRQRQPSVDFTPKPVSRIDSNDLQDMATTAATSSSPNTRGSPTRSTSSEESLKGPPQRTFSLDGSSSRGAFLDQSQGSLDTAPSIARRKSSHLSLFDLSQDVESDDESYAISPQIGTQRIPSDRPPELARRLLSPFPAKGNGSDGVSMDASAIRLPDMETEPK